MKLYDLKTLHMEQPVIDKLLVSHGKYAAADPMSYRKSTGLL